MDITYLQYMDAFFQLREFMDYYNRTMAHPFAWTYTGKPVRFCLNRHLLARVLQLGLAEVHQVLMRNDLRDRVALRTDGGLRTGRDVVMAAMLGAEEYGIGTAALIAMGCIMVRQCQSNTCPVGICTQDTKLREKFTGTADKVVNLITFYAQEVREILASIGARSMDEIIGRADLLALQDKLKGAE